MSKSLIFVLWGCLGIGLAACPLSAKPTNPPAASPAVAPEDQAPGAVMQKLSDLVHAGKYPEAHTLVTGLLLAYPDDQRLLKAMTLLDKLGDADAAAPAGNPAANNPATPETSLNAVQLTGMDKVEYTALIQRAREAQQTTDLERQKVLLKQFMDDSSQFLQRHPHQMLLWQFRIVSALSLDDMAAGFEAGQKLLAAGAADSNDPELQQLLGQLKNKGWLDQENVAAHLEAQANHDRLSKKFSWILGTWEALWRWKPCVGTSNPTVSKSRLKEAFFLTESNIEGCVIQPDGSQSKPDLRGDLLDSGEIRWEYYLPPSAAPGQYTFRTKGGGWSELDAKAGIGRMGFYAPDGGFWFSPENVGDGPFYPSGWQTVISCDHDLSTGSLTMVIPAQNTDPHSSEPRKHPVTLVFTKADESGGEQAR